ncbi:MAG: ROK family protein [Nitriliruptoraceae bacterium]
MRTVGIDLGGTNVYAVVLDGDTRVGGAKRKTPAKGGREGVIEALVKAAHAAVEAAGGTLEAVDAVGVGSPGVVIEGTVGGSSNVPGFSERFDLAAELRAALGRPIRIANDVNAGAVGEHRLGAGRGVDDLLCVFAGTGVGGGLVLRGQPFEGSHGGAGELGHVIVRQGGEVCPCGRRGCVEAYAGRRAMELAAERIRAAGTPTLLFDVMTDKGKSRATSGVFRTAFESGDRVVADLLEEAASVLAAGIASTVNLLDLERVVLGGGLADQLGEPFRRWVDAALQPLLFLQPPQVELVSAELGDEGGAIGAALLAREVV